MVATFLLLRSALVALLAGCFLPGVKLASSTPEDKAAVTYRTTVDEVRLTFLSTDNTGRHSTDLKENDFVVIDNTLVVRNFRSFTHLNVNKLGIIILIDGSESVTGRFQRELDSGLRLIEQAKWLEEGSTSVVVFGPMQPTLMCSGDCRRNLVWARMPREKNGATTPLFDSVVFAANFAAQHQARDTKTVLILFSDGEDTISLHSLVDAVDAAVAADVQLYSVDATAPRYRSPGKAILQELALATGGRYFRLEAGVGGLLTALLEDLQAGYMVTYEPPSRAPGLHPVRILPTRNLRLRFRSQHGYYYEAPSSIYRGAP